ncbi:MAG: hypothetical protein HOM34_03575 [Planctomycetes bacterium]|jgi:hypothetical protein|nr:hypothetical protein [Planctomycetota bacterium]MBT4028797.1 hypothetical protein [Planctomycetota bacterium]MBT4559643.1 hypothetical protein [Planctomycetota bacterium]MBT5100675.1 hypothetical protein [Planctomycetota bacterium]MBT5119787.1 hypothetical protein [Planctomycetota bacterium]
MKSFFRAAYAELWAAAHRRQIRMALLAVALVSGLRVFASWLIYSGASSASHQNLWPRFAEGAQTGLIVAELLALVILAGSLPREAAAGVLRDPLSRGASRAVHLLARVKVALTLPLVFALEAVLVSFLTALLFFDGGHVVASPMGASDDPIVIASFDSWLTERNVPIDNLALWVKRLDEGMTEQEASAAVGLPVFDFDSGDDFKDEFWELIPIFQFSEAEVRNGVFLGLLSGLPAFMVLGLFALFLSVLFRTGALASGIALASLFLYGGFFAGEYDDIAPYVFMSWLPGNGAMSVLENAGALADGFNDVAAPDPASLLIAHWAAAATGLVFVCASLLLFRKRAL